LSEYCNDSFDIAVYKDVPVEHTFSEEPNDDFSRYGFGEDYDYEKTGRVLYCCWNKESIKG
jgi:hypothetical protein